MKTATFNKNENRQSTPTVSETHGRNDIASYRSQNKYKLPAENILLSVIFLLLAVDAERQIWNHQTLNNGVQLPMVGFGTWDVRGEKGRRCILDALELGCRLIDTAQMYGNEAIVGEAVRESGLPRQDIFITTKLYRPSAGYQKAKAGIEKSLHELQTDYIDLVLIHEPYENAPEMYEALKEAYWAGKIRAIGVSNFDAQRYRAFIRTCGVIPTVDQVESHVYYPALPCIG